MPKPSDLLSALSGITAGLERGLEARRLEKIRQKELELQSRKLDIEEAQNYKLSEMSGLKLQAQGEALEFKREAAKSAAETAQSRVELMKTTSDLNNLRGQKIVEDIKLNKDNAMKELSGEAVKAIDTKKETYKNWQKDHMNIEMEYNETLKHAPGYVGPIKAKLDKSSEIGRQLETEVAQSVKIRKNISEGKKFDHEVAEIGNPNLVLDEIKINKFLTSPMKDSMTEKLSKKSFEEALSLTPEQGGFSDEEVKALDFMKSANDGSYKAFRDTVNKHRRLRIEFDGYLHKSPNEWFKKRGFQ